MKKTCEVCSGKKIYRLANGKRKLEKCQFCSGTGKYVRPVNA